MKTVFDVLSSSANEYNLSDSAYPLAKSSSISSTRRVTVLCDKLIFSLLTGHKRAAISTVHSFEKLPSGEGLAGLCQPNLRHFNASR